MLTAYGLSHPGHVRKINEDSWLSDPELGLFVVADGMGGHNAGEVASQLAVETMRSFLRRTQQDRDVTWPYGIDPAISFEANRLVTAIKLANRRVFKNGESREEYTGMGTTVVAILMAGDHVVMASVGDSRIYSFAKGSLEQVTVDDSWIQTVKADPTAPPIPADHPMRHVLTKVIGAREHLEVQATERPWRDDEVFLLCSDGLREDIEDPAIEAILRSKTDVQPMAEGLMEAALGGRAPDNVTVLLLKTHR